MSKSSPKTPYLHFYPQLDNHIEAWVVGNKKGLKALQKAIKKALKKGKVSGKTAFAGDGEGYRVLVLPTSDIEMQNLRLPYYDLKDSKNHPYYLVSSEDYKAAMMGKKP